jgi:transcription termination/antitermination protein NusG
MNGLGEMDSMQTNDTSIRMASTEYQESAWWAVYTRHQHEKTVASMLENKGFEVFLPLYNSERRWKDRSKMLSLPVFPSYVFVRGDLTRRLQIVSTPGAHMIVSNGTQFSEIPQHEIEAIRRAVEGPNKVEPHPLLKMGDQVRVIRGALQGLEGILVRKRSSCRLVLTVSMLAQSAAVEIDALDVEPIQSQEAGVMVGQSNPTPSLLSAWPQKSGLRERAVAVAL